MRCARDAELSGCFVCRVAPLVERCDTCLWLLSAWHWMVVNSSEMLLEFFFVGSGEPFTVVLNGALVVLVEGLCILVKVLPRIALCRFWWRMALGTFGWRFSPGLLRIVSVVAVLSVEMSYGGLVSAVGARLAVLLVEASVLHCGLPLARGRDSLRCMSPSSVFRWLLKVVMLHCGFPHRRFGVGSSIGRDRGGTFLLLRVRELPRFSLPVRQSRCVMFWVLFGVDMIVVLLKSSAFRVLLLWVSGGESPSMGPVSFWAVGLRFFVRGFRQASGGESFLLARVVVSAAGAPMLQPAEFCILCCAVCLFVSFMRRFTSLLDVGGVELSASGSRVLA
ncbi:hypothetical protein Taro_035841 [Colocasia esculenta]|uniref:Uncharacterized protein n=1 Tax=Colocasia esculenta TaxID=4460 RepID=A0A843WJV5_COLES|nr:hypothetical protein [Colocasia esculenta]